MYEEHGRGFEKEDRQGPRMKATRWGDIEASREGRFGRIVRPSLFSLPVLVLTSYWALRPPI
jgi:hypothetical protein